MRVAALGQAGQLNSTRLYLVRHGQVADGHTHRYHGHNDIGLSPQGVQQLERLAEQLRPVSLAAVYASDLARSREGAAILCRGRGLSFEAVPEFREINFGLWEGLTLEEIAQRYPEQLEARLRDGLGGPCRSEPGHPVRGLRASLNPPVPPPSELRLPQYH